MNNCPNEILGLIFAEACTDGGYTGRSLSLVSKRVCGASDRRYALQSIALYGSSQLSAFASLLDTVDADSRVYHLYLADRRRVQIECPPGQDQEQWLKERAAEDFHANNPSREYPADIILGILERVAPTVRTLVILLFDRYDQQPLTDAIRFSKLENLTIHASNLNHLAQPPLPECLSLRRLHVIEDFVLHRLSLTKAVSRLSPLLTHLRFSRLFLGKVTAGDVMEGLKRMLQQDDFASTGFSPTLQRVLVHMHRQRPDRRGRYDVDPVRSSAAAFAFFLKLTVQFVGR